MEIKDLLALEEVNQIKFTEKEQQKMQEIFSLMDEKEKDLSSIDTDNLQSAVYVMPIYNVFREDERKQPFSREELLKGAPQATEDSWQVPRLVK